MEDMATVMLVGVGLAVVLVDVEGQQAAVVAAVEVVVDVEVVAAAVVEEVVAAE
jgi:hypothetical protein